MDSLLCGFLLVLCAGVAAGSWLDGDDGVDRPYGDLPDMPITNMSCSAAARDCATLCAGCDVCAHWLDSWGAPLFTQRSPRQDPGPGTTARLLGDIPQCSSSPSPLSHKLFQPPCLCYPSPLWGNRAADCRAADPGPKAGRRECVFRLSTVIFI